jgi:hypothetical protein
MEPTKGDFDINRGNGGNETAFELARENGISLMPILCYTAKWASMHPDVPPNDKFNSINKFNGSYYLSKNVSDWTNYIEKVVSHYSKPPYNVRYFQIWNEPNSSELDEFYSGTYQDFVDKIYIPAANVIHKYGCKVVYGGWATIDPPLKNHLDTWLNYHQCWKYTDIFDWHYPGAETWNILYPKWVTNHKKNGLWETEYIGPSTNDYFLPEYIIPMVKWALNHNWNYKDKYRVFYYQLLEGSTNIPSESDDPNEYLKRNDLYKRLPAIGSPLAVEYPHGKAMKVIMDLYKGPLHNYPKPIELMGTARGWGLWAGNSLIIYVKNIIGRKNIKLQFTEFPPGGRNRIEKIEKVNPFTGEPVILEYTQTKEDGLVFSIPINLKPGAYVKISFIGNPLSYSNKS